MIRHAPLWAALTAVLVVLSGCGDKADPLTAPSDGGNGGPSTATYAQDVKPILDQNCIVCHSVDNSGAQRNGAPTSVNFDTYELAVANSARANARIQAGTMPPGGGLDQDARDTFQEWISAEMPRGDI